MILVAESQERSRKTHQPTKNTYSTYIYTYIQTYIQPNIQAYIHTYSTHINTKKEIAILIIVALSFAWVDIPMYYLDFSSNTGRKDDRSGVATMLTISTLAPTVYL